MNAKIVHLENRAACWRMAVRQSRTVEGLRRLAEWLVDEMEEADEQARERGEVRPHLYEASQIGPDGAILEAGHEGERVVL